MTEHETEEIVLQVLSTVLKRPLPLGRDTSTENTAEWDSLKHIEIMFAVEEELGIQFSEEELGNLHSAAAIVAASLVKCDEA